MLKNTLVIIPTYNEAGFIHKLLSDLFTLNLDVLVVDDGSSDGTINLAKTVDTQGNQINFLIRDRKLGLGNAYRSGFAWALSNGYERIIQMDADGSHQVNDLKAMLRYSDENPEVELIIDLDGLQVAQLKIGVSSANYYQEVPIVIPK